MFNILLTLILLLIPTLAIAQTEQPIQAKPADFQWDNRILVVTANSESDSLYQKQMREFEDREEGFRDRDLIIFSLFRNGMSRLDQQALHQESSEAILEKYGSGDSDFRILLIGKDGGVKLQKDAPVSVEDIFGLIDSMPMRQREMREGTGR